MYFLNAFCMSPSDFCTNLATVLAPSLSTAAAPEAWGAAASADKPLSWLSATSAANSAVFSGSFLSAAPKSDQLGTGGEGGASMEMPDGH
jgi:hypothetical protein